MIGHGHYMFFNQSEIQVESFSAIYFTFWRLYLKTITSIVLLTALLVFRSDCPLYVVSAALSGARFRALHRGHGRHRRRLCVCQGAVRDRMEE